MTETTPRRYQWTRTLGLVAALLVIMVVPPGAQTRQAAARVAGAVSGNVVEQLDLLVGRSAVLRMDRPITRVSLSTPDIADALVTSPYEVLIHGKMPGTISLLIWGDTGNISTYDVAVRRDLGVLEERLRVLFPGETIGVASNGTDVVLSGIVSTKYVVDKAAAVAVGYVESPENVVNLLHQQEGVATNQVLLRVRFAEVSRTAMQELGASFFTAFNGRKEWVGRITTQQFAAPNFNEPDKSPFDQGLAFSDFLNLFAFQSGENLGTVIRALKTRGLFQSLAEPNLITQNGKEASFLAGGEYPYPVLQGSGLAGAVTIVFKEFGVRLRFTPTVVGDDLIQLKVAPEVSALDFSNAVTIEGFRVPALSTRRTETEVELRDGQTFAISGLLDNTVTETMRKIPGIGDIPILGYLFRSRAYQKNATELVVMITPHIVRRDEPGVTSNLPNLVQPFLPPPERTLPPPPPAFIRPQSRASTEQPVATVELNVPAASVVEPPTVSPAERPAATAATVAPARVNADVAAHADTASSPGPPQLPAGSGVQPPAKSHNESLAASPVESAAVSSVEQPASSPIERLSTKAERKAIERARKEEEKRLEEAEKRLKQESREAERRARAQGEIDRKRLEEERKQTERDRKAAEKLAKEEARRQAEEAKRAAEVESEQLKAERKVAEEKRKAEEKLAKEAAKRGAEIQKIMAEHRRAMEDAQRRLGNGQLDARTRLVIPMNESKTR